MAYLVNVLVAFDQFCNALLGGNPMETISFRSAMAAAKGSKVGCLMCRFLNIFQKDHCAKTVEDMDKAKLIIPFGSRKTIQTLEDL